MATIELSKKEALRLVGKPISDKALQERIPMLGFSLEMLDKNTITLEVLPNRPDVLSEPGFARVLSAFMGIKTGLREYKAKNGKYKVIVNKNLKDIRPYTACAVVKNLKLDEQNIKDIINMQEKLHITFCRNRKKAAIGIYPMEKITWPIRFEARRPSEIRFVPLDGDVELNGFDILEFHPTGREFKHLLDGLKMYPVFVDANKKILSMPPVINSEDVGKITAETKDVFIEVSGFDLGYLSSCLNIIVTALADLGGTIYSVDVAYGKSARMPNLKPRMMKLDVSYAEKMLGTRLQRAQIPKLLAKMGFGYKNNKVLVPSYRTDILHPIDIVEDLAIAYGYERFTPEIPNIATMGAEDSFSKLFTRAANLLVGLGITEVSTHHLSKKGLQEGFVTELVEVENSVSDEYNVLRGSLVPSLLHVLTNNKHHEYPQKIFEVGTVFNAGEENLQLSVALTHAAANFTEIKQVCEAVLSNLGLQASYKERESLGFVVGRTASVLVKGKEIGVIGEVHPAMLEKFGLEMPVAALTIDMKKAGSFC